MKISVICFLATAGDVHKARQTIKDDVNSGYVVVWETDVTLVRRAWRRALLALCGLARLQWRATVLGLCLRTAPFKGHPPWMYLGLVNMWTGFI